MKMFEPFASWLPVDRQRLGWRSDNELIGNLTLKGGSKI